MTSEQVALWAGEIERWCEEIATAAHALVVQARSIQQRQVTSAPQPAREAEIPLYPEGND